MNRVVLAILSYASIISGALLWVWAAQDSIVNGKELLGFTLIVLGVVGAYKAAQAATREERE